ncbi:MAG: MATE family efflux transporter, partial [Muribaculaceae bacterium]|nr:MATE family efflux transporter [Muribaculaceae bacterium]
MSESNQNHSKLSELESRSVGRLLWEYSLPAVVGMMVMSLYNVIDRIFIGQGVGADAIAGLAITFPVMNLSAAVGVLIGVGAGARMSIVLGRKDHRSAELILGNSLTLTLVNARIYLTIFTIFIDDILIAFGQK